MKQSTGRLKLANHVSQKGIIALWSEPKWSRHCTDLVYVHCLNASLLFILYVLSRQSSDKAGAEFPFPWKHLTLPRLTALFKGTEMSLNILPPSWPFPMPTISPHPELQLLRLSCPPVASKLRYCMLQSIELGSRKFPTVLWTVKY